MENYTEVPKRSLLQQVDTNSEFYILSSNTENKSSFSGKSSVPRRFTTDGNVNRNAQSSSHNVGKRSSLPGKLPETAKTRYSTSTDSSFLSTSFTEKSSKGQSLLLLAILVVALISSQTYITLKKKQTSIEGSSTLPIRPPNESDKEIAQSIARRISSQLRVLGPLDSLEIQEDISSRYSESHAQHLLPLIYEELSVHSEVTMEMKGENSLWKAKL